MRNIDTIWTPGRAGAPPADPPSAVSDSCVALSSGPCHTAGRWPRDGACRVLLVDDDPYALRTLGIFLETAGCQVRTAGSGGAALAVASVWPCDAVVSDLRLPDVSGLELLGRMRSREFCGPIFMISGYGTIELATAAMKMGATDFLVKPVDGDRLVELVGQALRAKQRTPEAWESEVMRGSAAGFTATRGPLGPVRRAIDDVQEEIACLHAVSENMPPQRMRYSLFDVLERGLLSDRMDVREFLATGAALRRLVGLGEEASSRALVHSVADALGEVRAVAKQPYHSKVVQALAEFDRGDKATLAMSEQQMARTLAVSGAHLGRLLHTQTGLGFRDWRRGRRLQQAVSLLASNNEYVGQIAYAVGYADASQFAHEFRQTFGLSPSTFRRMVRRVWTASRQVIDGRWNHRRSHTDTE